MRIPDYQYPIEECDVPEVRRKALKEYRTFRRKCLEYMRGEADTSVMKQVRDLAWHTAVFRTLNEARRIENDRPINGALWNLITAGYASLMTLGIRKLVDKDPRTDSLWNVVSLVERRPELLTREKFVCYDGLPYDNEKVYREYLSSLDSVNGGVAIKLLPTTGPQAWAMSELLHKTFDKLSGSIPEKRKPTDKIQLTVIEAVKKSLSHPAIEKVLTLADQRIAHAQRVSENAKPVPVASYNDIDQALRQIVRTANFLSSCFFYDVSYSSVVPTPQFNVLEALDQPWVTQDNLTTLHKYWREISESMDTWAEGTDNEFLQMP
jgi:AbiU2